LLFVVSPVVADVKLPAVIGDNMVVQRDTKVPIWGTAEPGEKVTVILGEQTASAASATADAAGRWKVQLGPVPAGGPFEMTVAGKNTITLKNILVGEVWAASGQSNMEWSVQASANPKQEIAEAKYPKIRLFTVQKAVASEPKSDCVGKWVECSPETVPGFSAVAYFFGRHLHKTLEVPVGLINTSWGGTVAEAWTSRPALEASADFKPIVDRRDQTFSGYPKAKEQYEKQLAEWKAAVEKAKSEGKEPPKQPPAPRDPLSDPNLASNLYNGMVSPLVPYAIRGAIWYQGESNAGRAYQYRKLFPAMIQDWRKAWGNDFPFLFVQLANFNPGQPEPAESTGESDWAELREAQLLTLSLPNSGMAVIIDIGDAKDIHPKNKQDVGRRLALNALHMSYGKDVVYSGPSFDKMQTEGSTVRLKFKHVGGGLVAQGGGPLKGFAVAGADKKFHVAEARIEGDTVVLHSDQVEKPAGVRYAWANNPAGNLFNNEGLPASPFRTDDWPGVTVDRR
jgi:sialate O-acetylesterase